jgi:putative endonuclease
MSEFFVYLIVSEKDGSIYTGCTNDLKRRLIEHNSGLSPYTKTKCLWSLKWYSVFFNKEKAFNFEKYLKTSSGKAFINKRIIPKK